MDASYREADQLQVTALARAWRVTAMVAYMDAGEGAVITEHRFPADTGPGALPADRADRPLLVHMLYRPGHYDVAYPRGEADVLAATSQM